MITKAQSGKLIKAIHKFLEESAIKTVKKSTDTLRRMPITVIEKPAYPFLDGNGLIKEKVNILNNGNPVDFFREKAFVIHSKVEPTLQYFLTESGKVFPPMGATLIAKQPFTIQNTFQKIWIYKNHERKFSYIDKENRCITMKKEKSISVAQQWLQRVGYF